MRQVGTRLDAEVVEQASGRLLAEGARLSESLSRLAPTTFVPKGIYRFGSHDEANRHWVECLAHGMGLLALKRR